LKLDGKIFNLYQADLFVKAGATVKGIGKSETKTIFILFEVNEKFIELIDKWNKRLPLL
jgi:hypothetical protein